MKYLADTSLGPCPLELALAAILELLDEKFGEEGYNLETIAGCTGEDGLPYLAAEGMASDGTQFREATRLYPAPTPRPPVC